MGESRRARRGSPRCAVPRFGCFVARRGTEARRGGATTDLQALKYAAYCSQLRVSDVVDMYVRYHRVSQDDVAAQLYEHAPAIEEEELGKVRIRLVAGAFGPNVSTVVLWLNEMGIDIGCIEVRARRLRESDAAVVTARQLLPPPSAGSIWYVAAFGGHTKKSETSAAGVAIRLPSFWTTTRSRSARASSAPWPVRRPRRELVQPLVAQESDRGRASWTGLGAREALRWKYDGATYSPTALVKKILMDAGAKRRAVPGPWYWELPDGKSLAGLAVELEPAAIDAVPGGRQAAPSSETQ